MKSENIKRVAALVFLIMLSCAGKMGPESNSAGSQDSDSLRQCQAQQQRQDSSAPVGPKQINPALQQISEKESKTAQGINLGWMPAAAVR